VRVRHARTDLVDDADGVPAGDGRESEGQDLGEVTGAQDDVDGIHAGGAHRDADRTFSGMGFGCVIEDENVGVSVGVKTGSAHEEISFLTGMVRQILATERNVSPIPFRGK
jgi:hypothetical protein